MIRFLTQHPGTAEMFVGMGLFPNLDRARRRLRRLYEKGDIGFMQYVEMPDGRRVIVYSKFRISNPIHELLLTWWCLQVKANEIRRLYAVDKKFNADAEVVIDGKTFHVELDRGTEGYAQVKKQMKVYEHADVLWIAPTEARMKGLMKLTDCPTFWFATYDQAMKPHTEVWRNPQGETATLPVPQGTNV